MDSKVIKTIQSEKFKEEMAVLHKLYNTLSFDDRLAFMDSLSSRHRSMLMVMSLLLQHELEYQQIANLMCININTVKQYIYALEAHGWVLKKTPQLGGERGKPRFAVNFKP